MPLKECRTAAEVRALYQEVRERLPQQIAAHAQPQQPPTPVWSIPLSPVQRIVTAVAHQFDVTPAEIMSHQCRGGVVVARSVAIYLAREVSGLTPSAIGVAFHLGPDTLLHRRDVVVRHRATDDLVHELESTAPR